MLLARHTAGKRGNRNLEGAAAAGGKGEVVKAGADTGRPDPDPSSLSTCGAGPEANGKGGGRKRQGGERKRATGMSE